MKLLFYTQNISGIGSLISNFFLRQWQLIFNGSVHRKGKKSFSVDYNCFLPWQWKKKTKKNLIDSPGLVSVLGNTSGCSVYLASIYNWSGLISSLCAGQRCETSCFKRIFFPCVFSTNCVWIFSWPAWVIINYLITESEVVTGKSQTKASN